MSGQTILAPTLSVNDAACIAMQTSMKKRLAANSQVTPVHLCSHMNEISCCSVIRYSYTARAECDMSSSRQDNVVDDVLT